jgi:hypothetical protein
MTITQDELKRAIAEAAQSAGTSANGRSALAEIIVRSAEPNHLALSLFSAFMQVRSLNPGDNFMYTVRRGRYPVRQMVPGTVHMTDAVYSADKTAFVFDRLIAGTSHNLWEVQSGDIGTVESMRNALQADVIDAIVARVFTALTTVWNATDTPTNYTDASGTGATTTILDSMIENVLDRAGSVRAIIGTRRALYPLYDDMTFATLTSGANVSLIPTDQFQQFYQNNRVADYKGITVVELGQVYANDLPDIRRPLLPTDKIIVVGDDAGMIATMGGFEYQDMTDLRKQPAEYVLHGWQAYGMIVDQVDKIGVIRTNT